jgi:hypothetical protein
VSKDVSKFCILKLGHKKSQASGIGPPHHTTQNKIRTMSAFQINDAIVITSTDPPLKGTVAHLGPVQFAPGSDWIGIKLTSDSTGKGKNNGTVKGIFYFDAGGENNGMFVRSSNVKKIQDDSTNVSPRKSGIPLPSPRRSGSNSSDKSLSKMNKSPVTNAAAASRENFLRRLEQQKIKQDVDEISKECSEVVEKVTTVADEVSEDMTAKDMSKSEGTTQHKDPTTARNILESKQTAVPSVSKMADKVTDQPAQPDFNMPRGNQNEEMSTVMSFLSTQSNLTHDQLSLDWLKDLDASSLVFLKGLASGDDSSAANTGVALTQNLGCDKSSMDWVKDVDPSSMEYLKNMASGNVAVASLDDQPNDASNGDSTVDVLEKIAKATRSPLSLAAPKKTSTQTEFATQPPSSEKLSPIELRMLTMIENQNNQIQKMQAQLDAMNNMMSQMGCDVRYLCESQQRRDQNGGKDSYRGMPFQRLPYSGVSGRAHPPPPPPPLPPGMMATPPLVNQPPQNQVTNAAGQREQPFQRGIFFPVINYVFQGIISFITNFRSILLSTAPGRLYNHIRNQAIQRRAFANVDLKALLKLVVMLAIFSGRLERGGDGARRRGNARRVQRNINDEGGMAAIVAGFVDAAMVFLRNHRVHVLVVASMIGFLVSSGLMSFFYDVLWVEREELVNVWLGRVDEATGNENNAEGQDQAGGQQPNANADEPAAAADRANQGIGAQGAGPNAALGVQNARYNRQVNHQRGGMIRRGANGGFFHDIYCLVFSFILSLIPAWKPEEAAPPPEPNQQLPTNDAVEGDDAQNE